MISKLDLVATYRTACSPGRIRWWEQQSQNSAEKYKYYFIFIFFKTDETTSRTERRENLRYPEGRCIISWEMQEKYSPPFWILRQVTPGILNTIAATKTVSYFLSLSALFFRERGELTLKTSPAVAEEGHQNERPPISGSQEAKSGRRAES